jgi:AraC family ethanolamine operon transcriptional activator
MRRIYANLDSIDELEAASGGWSLDFYQLDRGRLRTEFEQIGTDRVILSRIRFNRALDQRGCPPPGLLTFGFLDADGPDVRWCGREAAKHTLLNFNGAGGFESVSQSGHHGFTFSVPEDQLAIAAGTVGASALEQCLDAVTEAPSFYTAEVGALRLLARELYDSIHRDPGLLMSPSFEERLEFELSYHLVSALASAKPESGTYTSRQRAVKKARALIEDRLGEPLTVREICDQTGVSWRTLDYAFREQLDMTPQAYLKAIRLDEVRRLLRTKSCATVALAARRCGFRHLSKFAADYRSHFGESPSDTLRFSKP